MSNPLYKLYCEAGCPKGEPDHDAVNLWAKEEILRLRKSPWVRNTPETRPKQDGCQFLVIARDNSEANEVYMTLVTLLVSDGIRWADNVYNYILADEEVLFYMPIPATPKEGT